MEPQLTEQIKETSVRPKSLHTDISINLGALIMPDWQWLKTSIPQITFEDFLEFLAPPQPKLNLDLTMKSLHKDPNCMLPSGWWTSFDKDPKDQQGKRM